MRKILFDDRQQLRNGWWMLLFVLVLVVSQFVYTPLSRSLQASGLDPLWREPLPFLFILAVTWICLRLRRERLAQVGLQLDRRWLRQAAAGFGLGLAAITLASAMLYALGGVQFTLAADGAAGLLIGLYIFIWVALFEELLFRGFLFQRMVAGTGPVIAQLSFALLFAIGHWDNPDMAGTVWAVATVDLILGALLLGLAYLRTGSLALPIGLHFGWNWAQGPLFGFDVSGYEHGGWLQPQLAASPDWLTGGGFGLEASICAVLVDLLLLVLLWRWRGSRAEPVSPLGAPAAAA